MSSLQSHNSTPGVKRQRGFIITVELILITTILVIGTLAGVVAIRDALVKQYAQKQSREVYVSDANGQVLGKAVDFDEHDAPRIPYIDRTLPPGTDGVQRNYRVLIGVRDDRFTSREPVYYSTENCTGTPCIKATSDERADSYDVASDGAAGAVSYLNALQGGPNYGIGRDTSGGFKGYLYRETSVACPFTPDAVVSRYISQKVVPGLPCEPVATSSGGTTTTGTTGGTSGPNIVEAYTDCIVGTDLTGAIIPCSCPSGYTDEGDVINAIDAEIQNSVNVGVDATRGFVKDLVPLQVGTICCPSGYSLDPANLADTVAFAILVPSIELAIGTVGSVDAKIQTTIQAVDDVLNNTALQCVQDGVAPPTDSGTVVESSVERTLQLHLAEPVSSPNDQTQNALAPFSAPFQVNLPADVAEDSWIYIPPDGEG